ncbi:MAG: hypothetical protein IJO63_04670 [Bacilli bacterium]|nr:hypothetical protein [Bacilli bacterium]
MIESLEDKTSIVLKDRVLSLLAYIWPLPIVLLFVPKKSIFFRKHLIKGIIVSILVTIWILSVLYIVKTRVDINLLNIVNGCLFIILIIFQLVQLFLIIKKKNY